MRKSVGIVVEYNPFHNGHKYHLSEAKKNGEVVIGVMSGDFVQRGEPSLINRWTRAEMALKEGVDIIVELPIYYSLQSAEIFARGSIGLLNTLGIEAIVFGSESGNKEKLEKIISLEKNEGFKEELQNEMKSGISYPNAYNKLIIKNLGKDYELTSNDILGLEYLRSIEKINPSIEAIPLKREGGGYYSEVGDNNILSATGIRKILEEDSIEKIEKFIPSFAYEILKEEVENKRYTNLSSFYSLIRYAIISKKDKLSEIQDMEIGLENRYYEVAVKSETYEEFMKNIVSKRHTIGRTQRIMLHILLNITKEITEKYKNKIPYTRILGFSSKGRKYLKGIAKEENEGVKILTTYKNVQKILTEEEMEILNLNEGGSLIYRMINKYIDRKIPLMTE